jgi:hexosaminidase
LKLSGFTRLLPFIFLSTFALTQAGASRAQAIPPPALMPLPAHVAWGDGQLVVTGNFTTRLEGDTDPRLELAKARFLEQLSRETGIPFRTGTEASSPIFTITTKSASEPVQRLGEDESYRLEVTAKAMQLTAANPLGVLRGLQTVLQLVHITPQGFVIPAVSIDDAPRFPWRGLMIDSGRHFIPVAVIQRNLDGMEAVKLNVFHWHISDDQGFRAESKVFPMLHEKGSNGLYYTQKQITEVIAYARDRGIRVVPEFDMPCHTTSWLAAYPELASGNGPYKIAYQWGVLDSAMNPAKGSTYRFLDRFIGEMTALFPDAYFHVGGDECDGKEWDANAEIKAFMQAHGLKDNAALQSYFSARVQKLVTAHHKIMEGWDEVLQPDTPRDVVIQSWRGQASLAAAARRGNRGLLSTGYYIDLNESAEKHYLVDPLSDDAASLDAEEKARILGGEATMWSEYVTADNIDSRVWPRTAAIAERFWSTQEVRDVPSMYARMTVVSQRLQYLGLQHASSTELMLERMTGDSDPKYLRVLASTVQPPEEYAREELGHFDTRSPLNRFVDAIPPESEVAREFNELAKQIAAGTATAEQLRQAREWLEQWRDNDAKLTPTLPKSDITAELIPVSRTLSQVAVIGLQALDDLENHRTPSTTESNLAALKAAEKPIAVVRNVIAPSVTLLVQAASRAKAVAAASRP